MKQTILYGDCHELIKKLPSGKFDLLYTNPPFGITEANWDVPLRWEELWSEIWRVLKPNGAVVLHSSMPFTFDLVASQRKYFKYNYVWKKNIATGFLLAKKQPLRKHEDICVFYKKQPTYNPQMTGSEFHKKRNVMMGGTEEYWGKSNHKGKWGEELVEGGHQGRYPNTVLEFPITKSKGHEKNASTRSPEMIDFFIKTYSNEGDWVLDVTCYNGITGERCKELNRNYLGMEKNKT